MTELNLIKGDFENKYTLVYNDGSRIQIKAGSYFLSDRGYYCFCKETFRELNRLLNKGDFTETIFEVYRKEVFCVFDERNVVIASKPRSRTKGGKTAPQIVKPVKKKAPVKRKTRARK